MNIIGVLFLIAVAYAKHEEYQGWKSYYVTPYSMDDLKFLRSLDVQYDLDFLGHPTVGGEGLVLVKPEHQEGFLKTLDNTNIVYRVHSEDVASALRQDDEDIKRRARTLSRNAVRLPYNNYQRLAEFDNYLEDVAKRYPDKATLVTAANSFEGRPIKYIKISSTNFADPRKKVIMIDGGIHAREWISPPIVTWAIHKLLEDVTEPDLLENFDFILLPIVNPDGYEYSHTNNRWWRKTRSTGSSNLSSYCPGVDGNRNYDFAWNKVGTSPNVCADNYAGNRAFSEVETRVVRDLIQEYLNRMVMYLTMHSYGSMILYPWGHDGSLSHNALDLHAVGIAMAEAINKEALPIFPKYVVGNSVQVIGYAASGAAEDYAHSVGVPLAYTFELPGLRGGLEGFNLPAQYIEQVCRETWSGIVAGLRRISLQ
ncbi:hypothetical protein ACJJTC_013088 [Scirpophaga incertulas]